MSAIAKIISGVVAVVLIGVGVYIGLTHQSNTAPADWKTYTNAQYGFELQYPEQYSLASQSFEPRVKVMAIYDPAEKTAEFGSYFLVSVQKSNLEQAVSDFKKNLSSAQLPIKGGSAVMFAGLPAYRIDYVSMGLPTRSILVAHGSETFDIQWTLDRPYFDQILSTFRFTK